MTWVVIAAACGAPSNAKTTTPITASHAVGSAGAACATSDECVALGKRILQAPASLVHEPMVAVAANTAALALFRAACANGYAVGCEMVGVLLESFDYYGLEEDGASASIAYERACELANAHACYLLGFAYWEGLLDHLSEHGTARRIDWPNDKRFGLKLLLHACNDFQQPDACKLIAELQHAGVI